MVLFENRSLDDVLGRLHGPDDGTAFDGVLGKPHPIVGRARGRPFGGAVHRGHRPDPDPDSGEEYFHTNTQLFNALDDHNRGTTGDAVTAPFNAPPPGATPTMDRFVTDYISTFTGEVGRQPTFDGYAHSARPGRSGSPGARWTVRLGPGRFGTIPDESQ